MKYSFRVDITSFLSQNPTFVFIDDSIRKSLFQEVNNGILKKTSEQLKVSIQNLSRYMNGKRAMPLSLFLKMLDVSSLDKECFQDRIKICVGKSGTRLELGPYILIDDKWVYISELIRGDGHIKKNLWGFYFVNKEINLINLVREFFIKLGVPKESMHLILKKSVWSLEIRSKILALIFWKIFNILPGKRGEDKLPEFYFNSGYAPAAIRGAFDAEGSVQIGNPSPRRIIISSKSRLWLIDLGRMLGELKIESSIREEIRCNISIFRLYVHGQINLKRFYDLIIPNHQKRLNKLKLLLKTYDKKRAVEGSIPTMLLESLKTSGPLKRTSISRKLNINKSRLSWYLTSLQQKQLISVVERTYTPKGSCYTYGITDFGIKKLEEDRSFR